MGIYNLGGGGGDPELQAKEATPLITNAQQIILPDEGYDGLSKVTVNPMPTGTLKTPTVNSIGYVSSGVQTAGYFDTSATSGLQLSTQAAKTITPTTYSQTAVASGKYTTGAVTVAGDTNLVSSNIVSGKSIFGVSGNYTGGISPLLVKAQASHNVPSSQTTNLEFSFSLDEKYTKMIAFIIESPIANLQQGDVQFINFISRGDDAITGYNPLAVGGGESEVYVTSLIYASQWRKTALYPYNLYRLSGTNCRFRVNSETDGGVYRYGLTYTLTAWFM